MGAVFVSGVLCYSYGAGCGSAELATKIEQSLCVSHPEDPCCPGSPIILDVEGNGFDLTDFAGGLRFNLNTTELHLLGRLNMFRRSSYVGIAAVLLLGVAVFVLCRGGGNASRPAAVSRSAAPEPPWAAPVQAPPALPASPSGVDRDRVASPPPSPPPSPPAQRPPVAAASTPLSSSFDDEIPIPTELPDTPSFNTELSRDGRVRDYREVYTYQLGLMAFYQRCMKGRIAHGVIYYYLRWQVDPDSHVASSPVFEHADVPSEGNVTPDDELAFAACVNEYVASHDRVVLPHGGANGEAWGMRAAFPLRDSALLQMIAKAKAEPGSQAPSTTSHQ